jgi:hypothetical protein
VSKVDDLQISYWILYGDRTYQLITIQITRVLIGRPFVCQGARGAEWRWGDSEVGCEGAARSRAEQDGRTGLLLFIRTGELRRRRTGLVQAVFFG